MSNTDSFLSLWESILFRRPSLGPGLGPRSLRNVSQTQQNLNVAYLASACHLVPVRLRRDLHGAGTDWLRDMHVMPLWPMRYEDEAPKGFWDGLSS